MIRQKIKIIFSLLTIFVAFIFIVLNSCADNPQKWVQHIGFEAKNGFPEGLFTPSGNPTAAIVDAPQISSSRILRVDLNRQTDKIPYRTELQPDHMPGPYFDEGHFARIGGEYWYALKVYLPQPWEYDNYHEIIMQWNSKPDEGEEWRFPPVALRIGSGKAGTGRDYLLYIYADSKKITPPEGTPDRFTTMTNDDLGDINEDLGKWTDWIFHIKWSYSGDGFIQIWKNGKVFFKKTNMSNADNDRLGPFFKFGIYKWCWNPEDSNFVAPYGINSRKVYFDDLRIGAGAVELKDILLNNISGN